MLYEKLQEYAASDNYPLHMPGHKRHCFGNMPKSVFDMDITEIDGFDNLHDANGILLSVQQKAARLYGAEESFYLVNGSTCGILAALSAALKPGGHILMARNCHRSAYHAAYLRNLNVSYLFPEIRDGICEAVTPEAVEKALSENADIDAVLIVSPTYEGRIANVGKIAEIVHDRNIPLIVDEAHGAHLGFHPAFAQNSCRLGADLVVQSVHKTLPALTQTALLHVNGDLIDREKLRRFLDIYESSSPSYVLMASIDNALCQVEEGGSELFDQFLKRWDNMLDKLSHCTKLKILSGGENQDIGKLPVSVGETGLTGKNLYDMLVKEYHLQPEMAAPGYVLAMFTVADTDEGFERLTQALLEIDAGIACAQDAPCTGECFTGDSFNCAKEAPSVMIPLAQAWDMPKEWVSIDECKDRTAGEFICLYPPEIPVAVPGEVLGESVLARIADAVSSGYDMMGVRERDGQFCLPVVY